MPLPSWGIALTLLELFATILALKHVLLYKRDTRAAAGWAAVIVLSPLVGALLYFVLGVNRMRRRAQKMNFPSRLPQPDVGGNSKAIASLDPAWQSLAGMVERLLGEPLTTGNQVQPLFHGSQTYPAMLEAIRNAKRSIGLSTYIFNRGKVGQQFAQALQQATQRGVAVRVLIDDIGARYSRPSFVPHLRSLGITVATFHPTSLVLLKPTSNLRNHRKILLVDGKLGFTGGINISDSPNEDTHLKVAGPVLACLHRTFLQDWNFSTGEALTDSSWQVDLTPRGTTPARVIVSGPDEDLGNTRTVLMGAISSAEKSIQIMTPYFLPDAALISHLRIAALRGVTVDIVLPLRSNIRLIDWACAALLWQLLENGCRIWHSPGPFQHGKVMVVDGAWVLMGSSNWDARSLRLNFECDVECYDQSFAKIMVDFLQQEMALAQPLSLQQVDGRSTMIRLRDGAARLLTPYL